MRLAARGRRDLDTGPEAITDRAERDQVWRQALVVHAKSLATAVAFTALAVLL